MFCMGSQLSASNLISLNCAQNDFNMDLVEHQVNPVNAIAKLVANLVATSDGVRSKRKRGTPWACPSSRQSESGCWPNRSRFQSATLMLKSRQQNNGLHT